MCSQETSVNCNGHHKTLISVFEKLLEQSTLADCTLTADGKLVKAHKEVLCAFSPYFEWLFKEEAEKNPTVILSGISYEVLRAMIDFMYLGKVRISEDKMGELMDASQFLHIKGFGNDCKKYVLANNNESSCAQTRQKCSSSGVPYKRRRKDEETASEASIELDELNGNTLQHQALASEVTKDVTLLPESIVKIELLDSELGEKTGGVKSQKKENHNTSGSADENAVLGLPADISKNSGDNSSESSSPVPNFEELILKTEPASEDEMLPSECECLPEERADACPEEMVEVVSGELECEQYEEDQNLSARSVSGSIEDRSPYTDLLPQQDYGIMQTSISEPSSTAAVRASGKRKKTKSQSEDMRTLTYYSCNECQKIFNQSFDLKVHMRIHTGERPYKCRFCDFTSAHVGNLNRHQLIHSEERPYKCPQCDFTTKHLNNIKQHQKIHTGERPYSCTECGFAAKRSTHLKEHMLIHRGERPYKCTQCDFAGTKSHDLKVHMFTHTGERPYKCTVCSFAAMRRSQLKSHMRSHVPDEVS